MLLRNAILIGVLAIGTRALAIEESNQVAYSDDAQQESALISIEADGTLLVRPPPPPRPQPPRPQPPRPQPPRPNPPPHPQPPPYPNPPPHPQPPPPAPYPPPYPPPYPGDRFVRCESWGYRYTECYLGSSVRRVTLQRQWSASPCIAYQTFGAQYDRMWVSNGCSGDFLVEYYW